jgi:hypothetical protein
MREMNLLFWNSLPLVFSRSVCDDMTRLLYLHWRLVKSNHDLTIILTVVALIEAVKGANGVPITQFLVQCGVNVSYKTFRHNLSALHWAKRMHLVDEVSLHDIIVLIT